MQSMKFIGQVLVMFLIAVLSAYAATPVPYSGKVAINGVNYFGEAQFAFSLHDGNGTTHWRNGNQPGETIKVTIRNGRYTVLLGGQGMNSLQPELFLKHDKLYLKVEFDNEDGEGLRHLTPDQLITATPRALVADVAEVAQVAEKVGHGAITRDMLSQEVLSQLDANATERPSTPITITRDMLPASVLNDLSKTVSITRDMLPQDVRDDLNRSVTITRSMLPADVLADLNKSSTTASPITLSMLAPEVTAKLGQNAATEANTSTLVAFRVRKENDQTGLTDGNYSKVTWESSSFDQTNNFDLAQDAFIVPEDGIYAISSSARFSFIETGVFANLVIKRNNQSINSGITIRAGGNSGVYISSVSAIVDANKSDILTIVGGQSGSVSPVSIINSSATYFEGFKIAGNYFNSIQPKSITKSMLGNDVLTDLNASIGMNRLSSEIRAKIDYNTTVADGSVTSSKIASNTITTSDLSEQILKYLKPEITAQPQAQTVYADSNVSFSVTAEGKYLTYQWKKDGVDLTGETNGSFTITDANATQHDGNYSVVVSNDFGSVESVFADVKVSSLMNGLVGWWPFDGNASDMSGNGNHGIVTGASVSSDKKGHAAKAYEFDGNGDYIVLPNLFYGNENFSLIYQTKVISSARQYNVQLSIGGVGTETILEIGYSSSLAFSFRSPNDIGENFSISSGANSLPLDQWKHFSWVFKPNEAQIYINGNLVNSKQSVPSNLAYLNNSFSGHKLILGSKWENGVYPNGNDNWEMNGLYDDLRIYDRALSAAEVQALYNLGQ